MWEGKGLHAHRWSHPIPSHPPYLLPTCSWGTRNLKLLLKKTQSLIQASDSPRGRGELGFALLAA